MGTKVKEQELNRKYFYAAVQLLVLALALMGLLYQVIQKPAVRFSVKEAFQEEAFDLTLESGLFGGPVYYTLDGNTPTLQSRVYEGPIHIEAGLPDKVTVVKAAVLMGGELGEVYTQTYFVGESVRELYDVMLVSLSADEEVLYDPETGILSNYKEKGEDGEWDRPAYIEFYEPDGTQMLAQGTGIAVSGNVSRDYEQKSIKLIADSSYDMDFPVFDCDFFDTDMGGNRTGQSYNRLVLRNGGSDHIGTMIKWNVASRLAKEAGVVCAGARPGILFLNGEYYGIIQLQEKYTRYNLSHALGVQKDDVETFGIIEVNSARFGGYYARLHRDLNLPENQEKLEQSVDMEDMLRYYGMNIIMNNNDWPFNNYRSFRCRDMGAEGYRDGKVHFLLYDLDQIYLDYGKEETYNLLDYLIETPIEDATDTLGLLLQSDRYRTGFVNVICDLTNTVYEEEHVLQVIEEECQRLARSMELYYTPQQQARQQQAVEEMKTAVEVSCSRVREGLKRHLGAEYPYLLTVEAPEHADITFSQIHLNGGERYSGTYYHNYPLTLTAEPENGQVQYGWLVNGEEVWTQELVLDESYTAEEIQVQLITEQ